MYHSSFNISRGYCVCQDEGTKQGWEQKLGTINITTLYVFMHIQLLTISVQTNLQSVYETIGVIRVSIAAC